MAVRYKYIRSLVDQLLSDNQIDGPDVQVEKLAAAKGAVVVRQEVQDEMSGFLYRDGSGGPPIIGVNSRHSQNRQRFTIAHELGHLLLHEGTRVRTDGAGYGIDFWFRRETAMSGESPDEDEIEANIFAAELLMPARFLQTDLSEFQGYDFLADDAETKVLRPLAKRYKVSTQALTFRLANLGYVKL